MILLLIILGAIYIAVTLFALRSQSPRKLRWGVTAALVTWLAWVVLMIPFVEVVAEYTGAAFDRAVLLAAVGTLLLWIAAPWVTMRIGVRLDPDHEA